MADIQLIQCKNQQKTTSYCRNSLLYNEIGIKKSNDDVKFFSSIVDTCLSCEDIARQSCGMVPRWRFFASFLRFVFSASHAQHISDLHSKFALRPHHMWKYGRHPICDCWD